LLLQELEVNKQYNKDTTYDDMAKEIAKVLDDACFSRNTKAVMDPRFVENPKHIKATLRHLLRQNFIIDAKQQAAGHHSVRIEDFSPQDLKVTVLHQKIASAMTDHPFIYAVSVLNPLGDAENQLLLNDFLQFTRNEFFQTAFQSTTDEVVNLGGAQFPNILTEYAEQLKKPVTMSNVWKQTNLKYLANCWEALDLILLPVKIESRLKLNAQLRTLDNIENLETDKFIDTKGSECNRESENTASWKIHQLYRNMGGVSSTFTVAEQPADIPSWCYVSINTNDRVWPDHVGISVPLKYCGTTNEPSFCMASFGRMGEEQPIRDVTLEIRHEQFPLNKNTKISWASIEQDWAHEHKFI